MSFKLSIETRFLYQVVNIISNAVKLCILIKKKESKAIDWCFCFALFYFNFGCYACRTGCIFPSI